jgi:hypothetical protein
MSGLVEGRGRSGHPILLHVAGVVGVPVCLAAGAFEFWRARSGNQLSWGYTVEWPLIAGYLVYVWVRLAREGRPGAGPGAGDHGPDDAAPSVPVAASPPDPQLLAWQQYLARLHAEDPPGGPASTGGLAPSRSGR